MDIKILGTGCAKCNSLEKLTKQVVDELGLEATITKEEDIIKIMEYGIMRTPGLVINEKVVLYGRVPTSKEMQNLITKNH